MADCSFLLRMLFSNWSSSSSSLCRTISTDIADPLSPQQQIVHCFRQVLRATSRIGTELLYVDSSWTSCLCSSIWRGPLEYITYELVPTSPAVSRMSGSANFRNGWKVAVQLLLYRVLSLGLVQYFSQHSCVIAVKLFLHTFSLRPCGASIKQYRHDAPAQAETQLPRLERAAAVIGLHVNAHKTECLGFNQTGDISTQNGSARKLVDKFTDQRTVSHQPRQSSTSN